MKLREKSREKKDEIREIMWLRVMESAFAFQYMISITIGHTRVYVIYIAYSLLHLVTSQASNPITNLLTN